MDAIVDVMANIATIALTWLPLVFFGLIVYLLWRSLALMPRVKPTKSSPIRSPLSTGRTSQASGKQLSSGRSSTSSSTRAASAVSARECPRGILLYGPPGTGKTLLNQAVAHASNANFYSQSASAFVEMFAGLGAARIRKLFEGAPQQACHRLHRRARRGRHARSGSSFNHEHDQTLNQLLVARRVPQARPCRHHRGVEPPGGHRPRPPSSGSADRQILVAPPDLAGREAILRVHTRGKPSLPTSTLEIVARQTAGLTGADLANMCNEAAIFAGRAEQQYIRHADFEAAMERIVASLQTRRVVTEKEKRILAYHEAGHALMSHLVGDPQPVQKVTIVSRGRALGYTLNAAGGRPYLHTRTSSST